jgi:hypothetical protein
VATRVTTRPPSPSRSSQFPSKAVCFSLFRLFVGGLLTVYLAHLSNTSHALPHNFSTLQHPLPCLQSFLSPSKSPAVAPPSLKETKAANEAKSAIPTFPPFEYASVFNSDKQYGDFRDDIVKKGYAVIPAVSRRTHGSKALSEATSVTTPLLLPSKSSPSPSKEVRFPPLFLLSESPLTLYHGLRHVPWVRCICGMYLCPFLDATIFSFFAS